ncbi:MAG TPA: HD domain-containing protein [Planctomycetota bacterium]|jgi:hypothetical protein|nr:hypothetical protein [Planctomycetota bacterium]MDP7245429.1 HD domain-containing protein [Planctomycetota bacterium]HJM39193.1 HD domain-containing protein [Planctomycetota bacterium]|tara:strand:- start:79340 stop:79942 length:603 start_codon:yes stop_codon:yes gene_type:complete
MSPKQARQILDAHSPPGEGWPLHCRQVAKVTRLVSDSLTAIGANLNSDDLEAQALLHDIGRVQTHGVMHGWAGFTLLRSLGHESVARACLTHWFKGRDESELRASGRLKESFINNLFSALNPPEWTLGDSVISFADSCVKHATIVSLNDRHADLIERYGDSSWMRRANELAVQHGEELSSTLGQPVENLVSPFYGDTLHA